MPCQILLLFKKKSSIICKILMSAVSVNMTLYVDMVNNKANTNN
jgi:hypothetical protein